MLDIMFEEVSDVTISNKQLTVTKEMIKIK